MLSKTYYAQNNAGIIGPGLVTIKSQSNMLKNLLNMPLGISQNFTYALYASHYACIMLQYKQN